MSKENNKNFTKYTNQGIQALAEEVKESAKNHKTKNKSWRLRASLMLKKVKKNLIAFKSKIKKFFGKKEENQPYEQVNTDHQVGNTTNQPVDSKEKSAKLSPKMQKMFDKAKEKRKMIKNAVKERAKFYKNARESKVKNPVKFYLCLSKGEVKYDVKLTLTEQNAHDQAIQDYLQTNANDAEKQEVISGLIKSCSAKKINSNKIASEYLKELGIDENKISEDLKNVQFEPLQLKPAIQKADKEKSEVMQEFKELYSQQNKVADRLGNISPNSTPGQATAKGQSGIAKT